MTSLLRGLFLCEAGMKQIIQTIQYLVAAAAIFMLLYFSYLIVVGIGAAMLPFFFVLAVVTVLVAKFDKDFNQEKE